MTIRLNYPQSVAVMNRNFTIGAVIGCYMLRVVSDKHVLWMAKRNDGVSEPEFRLWLLFITLLIFSCRLNYVFFQWADKVWPK